jgi:GTP pyrophosphokinase
MTERNIDILSMNTRTSKQGMATLSMSFEIAGRDELDNIVKKLSQIESVLDIERNNS